MENYKIATDFTCKEMRADARKSLKGKWGVSVGITLIYFAISSVISIVGSILGTLQGQNDSLFALFFGLSILWMLVSIFVVSPLSLGYTESFLKISDGGDTHCKNLFSKFILIFKSTGMMIIMAIKITLWSLLLIVPGIIAGLNYSMAPFIMIEDGNVGANEAIEISKKMMKGYKGKLFLLELSFIGWGILSVLSLGIGFIWLTPYIMTAESRFYRTVSSAYLENRDNKVNTAEQA